MSATALPRLLTAEEVSAQLAMPKWRLYELARADLIPVVRVGERAYRFDANALRAWIESGGNDGNGDS